MIKKELSEATKQKIREIREKECFAYMDRGGWLASLSPARKKQALKWYKQCLDATKTGILPKRPAWIK